jgi:hypothetical protein
LFFVVCPAAQQPLSVAKSSRAAKVFRPEAYGGRVHQTKVSAGKYPIHRDLLNSAATRIPSRARYRFGRLLGWFERIYIRPDYRKLGCGGLGPSGPA